MVDQYFGYDSLEHFECIFMAPLTLWNVYLWLRWPFSMRGHEHIFMMGKSTIDFFLLQANFTLLWNIELGTRKWYNFGYIAMAYILAREEFPSY